MKPYALDREEGELIWMFDSLDTVKAGVDETGGALTAVEFLDFESSSVPLHVNHQWDCGFYVLEGHYTFVIGEEVVAAAHGTWVFVPRDTAHAWRCESAHGRVLSISTPGGFERFYRTVGTPVTDRTEVPPRTEPDIEALSTVAARHGIAIVGPPPGG